MTRVSLSEKEGGIEQGGEGRGKWEMNAPSENTQSAESLRGRGGGGERERKREREAVVRALFITSLEICFQKYFS